MTEANVSGGDKNGGLTQPERNTTANPQLVIVEAQGVAVHEKTLLPGIRTPYGYFVLLTALSTPINDSSVVLHARESGWRERKFLSALSMAESTEAH
jgi:hypothetical protein